MIVVIEGLAGSGKTWYMVRLAKKYWKKGSKVYPNFPLWYETTENIKRWHNLDECFNLTKGVMLIDESQKFLDARRWQSLPVRFTEKIAMHRHDLVDIITTTQDLAHIDVRMRQNVHILFKCRSLLRFPISQAYKPIIQIIEIRRKQRKVHEKSGRMFWVNDGPAEYHLISKFWTKSYYNTYGDVGEHKFICRIKRDKKKINLKEDWKVKIFAKELVDRGKARI